MNYRQYIPEENMLVIWVGTSDGNGREILSDRTHLCASILNAAADMEAILADAYDPLIKQLSDYLSVIEAMGV